MAVERVIVKEDIRNLRREVTTADKKSESRPQLSPELAPFGEPMSTVRL
jgi:hypothetical protein